ncbi:MAG: hypothetical protein L3K00_06205 [Thermoplasmata archaeon]|nr:hypothetical protein [Thermoplasmata archaeon]
MTVLRGRPSAVPLVLALAMLAVVLAAALGPATGVVSASASCQYGTCPSSGPSALTWGLGALLAAVILIVAIAIILQRRRGGPPSAGGGAGVAAWSGTSPESPAPAEAPPYLETPDDVGAATGAAVAGGAAAGAAAEPGDIDSLMGELDRISGEILKRGPGKKGPPSGGSDAGEAAADN